MLKTEGPLDPQRAGSLARNTDSRLPGVRVAWRVRTVPLTIHNSSMRSPGEHVASLAVSSWALSHPAPTWKPQLCSVRTSWEPDLLVMAAECLRQRSHEHLMGSWHGAGCPEARRPRQPDQVCECPGARARGCRAERWAGGTPQASPQRLPGCSWLTCLALKGLSLLPSNTISPVPLLLHPSEHEELLDYRTGFAGLNPQHQSDISSKWPRCW